MPCIVVIGFFIWVACLASAKYAVDVLIGAEQPYRKGIGPLGLLLALAGYLLVPSVVAAAVATFLGRSIDKAYQNKALTNTRTGTQKDLKDRANGPP